MTFSLKSILYTIGLLALLFVVLPGAALDVITTRMHKNMTEYVASTDTDAALQSLDGHLRDGARFSILWLLSGRQGFRRERNDEQNKFNGELARLKGKDELRARGALLDAAEEAAQKLFAAQNRAAPVQRGQYAYDILAPLIELREQAMVPLTELRISQEHERAALVAASERYERLSDWTARFIEVIALIALLAAIAFLSKIVITPLNELTEAITLYANGKTSTRVSGKHALVREVRDAGSCFNRLADRLNELELQKVEHLVGTVHDIRNPLTVLKTVSALLRSSRLDRNEGRQQGLMKLMDEQVDRMRHLVDDYIETQRIQAGTFTLSKQEIDLVPLIEGSLEAWKSASKSHVLRFQHPDRPILFWCDPNRIVQALNNLMSNAIKFSPNGGLIQITLSVHADGIVISVADQGLGITPDERDRMFQPFMRGRAVRDLIPGTGVGLSSVRKISEAHGGTVDYASRPGKGSTFFLRLPFRAHSERAA